MTRPKIKKMSFIVRGTPKWRKPRPRRRKPISFIFNGTGKPSRRKEQRLENLASMNLS